MVTGSSDSTVKIWGKLSTLKVPARTYNFCHRHDTNRGGSSGVKKGRLA